MLEFILAAILLTRPPDELTDPQNYGARHAIVETAVCWEILDPRELRYTLQQSDNLHHDLHWLRQRAVDLKDAPLASDAHRFPSRDTINELLAFNRSFREHVNVRKSVRPDQWQEHDALLNQTDYLYCLWDKIRDAQTPYYFVTVNRLALKSLKEHLGDEGYFGFNLPHVPLAYFRSVE